MKSILPTRTRTDWVDVISAVFVLIFIVTPLVGMVASHVYRDKVSSGEVYSDTLYIDAKNTNVGLGSNPTPSTGLPTTYASFGGGSEPIYTWSSGDKALIVAAPSKEIYRRDSKGNVTITIDPDMKSVSFEEKGVVLLVIGEVQP